MPYDIGVVGAGHISSSAHLPVLANMDNVRIKFIADREKRTSLARSYGAEAIRVRDDVSILPTCDIVLLAIPVGARAPYIEEFGERGTPIFSEKPFATDTETHQRFLDAADPITCNYLRTTFSPTLQMRRVVQSELFGELQDVHCAQGGVVGATGRTESNYQTDPSLRGGGMLLETGSHIVSQLLFILSGWELSGSEADIILHDGFDVDVGATVRARNGDRTVGIGIELSRIRPLKSVAEFVFENATLQFEVHTPGAPVTVVSNESRGPRRQLKFALDEYGAETFAQAIYTNWQRVLALVAEGANETGIKADPLGTGYDVTRVIENLYEIATIEEVA